MSPLHIGTLARHTLAMTAGMGLRSIIQAAVLLIVARALGVDGYGALTAILAIAGVFGHFSALGTPMLLVRDVARNNRSFQECWGLTLSVLAVAGPLLLGLYLLLAQQILPSSADWLSVFAFGLAEIVLMPVSQASVSAYQGHDRLGRASRMTLAPILPRLAAALALTPLLHMMGAEQALKIWALLYVFAALLSAIYSLYLVQRDLGRPKLPAVTGIGRKLFESATFACGGAANKVYVDIDKVMLARLSSLEDTGAYSAGYRVVDLAYIPLWALIMTVAPRLFRSGAQGTRHALVATLRLLPLPALYACAAGVLLYLSGDLLPLLLGQDYEETVSVLRYLAWLPLIATPRMLLQMTLNASSRQSSVALITTLAAFSNVLLNWLLIPGMGWTGAAIAVYCSELIMILMLASVVIRSRPDPSADTTLA